jgi:hypothetical protein
MTGGSSEASVTAGDRWCPCAIAVAWTQGGLSARIHRSCRRSDGCRTAALHGGQGLVCGGCAVHDEVMHGSSGC